MAYTCVNTANGPVCGTSTSAPITSDAGYPSAYPPTADPAQYYPTTAPTSQAGPSYALTCATPVTETYKVPRTIMTNRLETRTRTKLVPTTTMTTVQEPYQVNVPVPSTIYEDKTRTTMTTGACPPSTTVPTNPTAAPAPAPTDYPWTAPPATDPLYNPYPGYPAYTGYPGYTGYPAY